MVVSAVAAVADQGVGAEDSPAVARGPAEDSPGAEHAQVADLLEGHAPVRAHGRLAARPPLGPVGLVPVVQPVQRRVLQRVAVPGRVQGALGLEEYARDRSRERGRTLVLAVHAQQRCPPRVQEERRELVLAQGSEPDPRRARGWPIVPASRRNQPGCRAWVSEPQAQQARQELQERGWRMAGLVPRTAWQTGRGRSRTGRRT